MVGDMFGIGPEKLVLLFAAGLFVFGPEQLPHLAVRAARATRIVLDYCARLEAEIAREAAELSSPPANITSESTTDSGSQVHGDPRSAGHRPPPFDRDAT